MYIDGYILSESLRQSATVEQTVGMKAAWNYITSYHGKAEGLSEKSVRLMSGLITTNHQYRRVPAVFNQGMPALAPSLIPNAMEKWAKWLAYEIDPAHQGSVDVRATADYWTKEFLDIHPFADGNGRVGSLIWNYLMGTLDDPEPMPYFYGEKP